MLRFTLAVLLVSGSALAQNATSLRGRVLGTEQPLDQQAYAWDAAARTWSPFSFATASGSSNYCAPSGGNTTTYTCAPVPAFSAYTAGMVLAFKPDVTNTGASTLNVNSLGAKNIQKLSSGSLVAVAAGDLDADYVYLIRYTGTVFVIDSASNYISSVGPGFTVSPGGQLDYDPAVIPTLTGTNTWLGAQVATGASRTAPWKAGTTLPGTCAIGDSFFDTDATAGLNLFGCTAVNTWTLLGDGGTFSASALTDFAVSGMGTATLTVCSTCSPTVPGNTRWGSTVTRKLTSGTALLTGGVGADTAYIYVDSAGALTVGTTNRTITCTNCTAVTGVTSFPLNQSIPMWTCTITATTWDASGCTDYRAVYSANRLTAGSGITLTESAGSTQIAASNSSVCIDTAGLGYDWPMGNTGGTGNHDWPTNGANVTWAWQVNARCYQTLSKLTVNITVASGTCGGTCGFAMGLYDSTGALLSQSATITSGGSPNLNATGAITATLAAAQTVFGPYYIVASTNSTTLRLSAWNSDGYVPVLVNKNGNRYGRAANDSTGSSTITLPATLGAISPSTNGYGAPLVVLVER